MAIYSPIGRPTLYSVWLLTPTRTKIALIDRLIRLQLRLTVNTIGFAELILPTPFPLSWVQEDSCLKIWRQTPGGKKYLEGDTLWYIRDWDQSLTERGELAISIQAYTANEQLDRAIVDYAAETAYAQKTDNIDNLMKAIVRENLGSLATNGARDFSNWLTVEPDAGAGPTITRAFAWRNIYATLRELAQDADKLGNPVFFDIVMSGAGLEFRTYTGQRGVDHSSSGAVPVILSPRNGTLSEVRREYMSSMERNVVTVGGRGEGLERAIVRQEETTRLNISPINRRELFVDARNSETTAALEAEAGAAIRNHRPRESFNAKIRDTEAIKYGREYKFGDRIVAEFRGRAVDCRLDSIQIVVERGREEIRAELRADE